MDLKGRTAIVTGAGVVGTTIATTLAEHGAGAVVLVDLDIDRALAGAAAVQAVGATGVGLFCDITEPDTVAAMSAEALSLVGAIDIVVNNAGLPLTLFDPGSTMIKPFLASEPDEWMSWIRLGLIAPMLMCKAFVPGMVERGYGKVVTIVSDSGRTGDALVSSYAAAKAGSMGFMRSLATEVGKHGVNVNCISLGTLWRSDDEQTPDKHSSAIKRYPLRRYGYPAEVAALATFLASDAAGWITGQVYPLNGGYSYAL